MFKRRKSIRIKSGNNAERARFYSPPLLYNVFMFQCRDNPALTQNWQRTSADVLSEAKALNALKGQKVAGSSPVRPTKTRPETFLKESFPLRFTESLFSVAYWKGEKKRNGGYVMSVLRFSSCLRWI